jgi:hypothetical protein
MYSFIIPTLPYLAGWRNWNNKEESIKSLKSIKSPNTTLQPLQLYNFSTIFAKLFASLAQLVEQLIRNEQVVGSSPIGGSRDCGLRIVDLFLFIKFAFENPKSKIRIPKS